MTIPALVVQQWLPMWDRAKFEEGASRAKPEPQFYVFSMSAYDLRQLSGIYKRDPNKPPAEDTGIQRRHDAEKSRDVLNYISDGFPLSTLKKIRERKDQEADDLRMPGWLPGAVVVNILKPGSRRGMGTLDLDDSISVTIGERGAANILLPTTYPQDGKWSPAIHPIEVIDGQHRLWALTENNHPLWNDLEFKKAIRDFQIPVVAFYGLDITWQAYLFYTINQLPRKVDQNLVFDLYPLLRRQDWLEKFEGPNIYRDTRAQDLTILMWAHPESPWHKRIKRLDRKDEGVVSQAAFIRALTGSFIRRWKADSRSGSGGLFGNKVDGGDRLVLPWTREQQAAFLILLWREVRSAVIDSKAPWATTYLEGEIAGQQYLTQTDRQHDEVRLRERLFGSPNVSLLSGDQGVNSVMKVANSLLWAAVEWQQLPLGDWRWERPEETDDHQAISHALKDLETKIPKCTAFLRAMAQAIATFDLRTSSAIPDSDQIALRRQKIYKGSSGYRDLRTDLMKHIAETSISDIANLAKQFTQSISDESDD
jgi:hypothetical protein